MLTRPVSAGRVVAFSETITAEPTLGLVMCGEQGLNLASAGPYVPWSLAPPRAFSNLMGRAGLEPATLGLKVDGAGLARVRKWSQNGTVEPNQIGGFESSRTPMLTLR
jgi:hypothetical protein